VDYARLRAILELLELAEARLKIAADVLAAPSDDWAPLHDELEAMADELDDVVAELAAGK
jgi:hypothetical protein